ncbi:cyanate transporter [Shinella zoogloeoides]|jgi:CP family cyanate transporter-like MFS transporter|uniref:cyanate transporter n=1 Tax=Shinella zoogloeoides TaxID=352475 RepID=UPI00273FB715|nr:cyanate transporter [Shinella zoogloeoides]WLR91975.1 cyanate transporter [Shinella zoogloeoides]
MMTDTRAGDLAMLALVVLVGLNLRPFLAAPAPILVEIAADTGLGYGGIAMLTLLPMFLMGLGAFVAPGLQVKIGTRRGLLIALAILLAGSALRLFASDGLSLILTAALCGIGVAFIQAAFPGIIKARFPAHVPAVTGLYSAMIMAGGAFGARLMPVLVHAGYGWRAALAWLALPVAIALAAAWRILSDVQSSKPDGTLSRQLLRRPRTWALMAAFGLINAGYTSMIAWLAPYYQAQGWTSADSSGLVAVMAMCQALAALGLPILARRNIDRRRWLWMTIAFQAVGFLGLAGFPGAAPVVWAGLCGAGLGGSFALAIVTALDHLPRPEQAGALAALMQGGGFLIAAIGPYAMALLHDWTGGFAAGWILHLGCVLVTALLYLRFDPRHYPKAMPFSA